jgi:hypothetical protein
MMLFIARLPFEEDNGGGRQKFGEAERAAGQRSGPPDRGCGNHPF